MKKFLDVSNWQDIQEFDTIKNNYCGVICKATEGMSYTDKTYNWKTTELDKRGIPVGAYHFASPHTEPEEQAEHFYNTIKDSPLSIVPVLDIEDRNIKDKQDFTARFVKRFKTISDSEIIIYSYVSYISEFFVVSERKKYNWWIAHYEVGKPSTPQGVYVVAWQYTESEKVQGIIGGVDSNYLYDENLFFINPNQEIEKEVYNGFGQNGHATVIVNDLSIRTQPSLGSEVVARYNKGETFKYDWVIDNEGIRWVRYVGSTSGQFRYVASRELKGNEKRYLKCV